MELPWWLSGKESTCNAGDMVWSLGWEDPWEKETATHSSILGWETSWTEKPGGLQTMGLQRIGHNLVIKQPHRIIFYIVTEDVFYKNDLMTWESLYY